MTHKMHGTQADRVGQVQVTFTNKPMTVWRGACPVAAKFRERIGFWARVLVQVPVEERSPNAKGIYESGLSPIFSRCVEPRQFELYEGLGSLRSSRARGQAAGTGSPARPRSRSSETRPLRRSVSKCA